MKQKIVFDFTKFNTTDYKGEISSIIWYISCNLRCLYCYNDNLVFSKKGKYCQNDILEFLEKRKGLLTAVVLSGGEATIHNLIPICKKIKEMGFKIKLDTNGTNPKQIKELINHSLLDFISLDFKAIKNKFEKVSQKKTYLYDNFIQSLKYLISINFSFELRTTFNGTILDETDINNMIKTSYELGYKNTFYIQNFLQTKSNIADIKIDKRIDKDKIIKNLLKVEYRN